MNWNKMVERTGNNMFSTYSSLPDNYTDAKGDISHLLFRLGDKDLLDMDYNQENKCVSGAYTKDALKTFKKLGYRNARQVSYNNATAISEIKNNRPVYIDGCGLKKRKCFLWICWSRYSSCHAWVLDGYVKRTQLVTATVHSVCPGRNNMYSTYSYSYNNYLELVHNNFGWGGETDGSSKNNTNSSGWYYKGLFDSNRGPDKSSNTFRSDDKKNFRYDNDMLINIQP